MEQQQSDNLRSIGESNKRHYRSPRLVTYGSLRHLTQGGTGQSAEGQDTTNLTKKPVQSDIRVKENIVRIGDHPLGIGLYLFDYKPEYVDAWGHGRQFGVMAQEVEAVLPEAVLVHPNGYKMVDYDMLGITRADH